MFNSKPLDYQRVVVVVCHLDVDTFQKMVPEVGKNTIKSQRIEMHGTDSTVLT